MINLYRIISVLQNVSNGYSEAKEEVLSLPDSAVRPEGPGAPVALDFLGTRAQAVAAGPFRHSASRGYTPP